MYLLAAVGAKAVALVERLGRQVLRQGPERERRDSLIGRPGDRLTEQRRADPGSPARWIDVDCDQLADLGAEISVASGDDYIAGTGNLTVQLSNDADRATFEPLEVRADVSLPGLHREAREAIVLDDSPVRGPPGTGNDLGDSLRVRRHRIPDLDHWAACRSERSSRAAPM